MFQCNILLNIPNLRWMFWSNSMSESGWKIVVDAFFNMLHFVAPPSLSLSLSQSFLARNHFRTEIKQQFKFPRSHSCSREKYSKCFNKEFQGLGARAPVEISENGPREKFGFSLIAFTTSSHFMGGKLKIGCHFHSSVTPNDLQTKNTLPNITNADNKVYLDLWCCCNVMI